MRYGLDNNVPKIIVDESEIKFTDQQFPESFRTQCEAGSPPLLKCILYAASCVSANMKLETCGHFDVDFIDSLLRAFVAGERRKGQCCRVAGAAGAGPYSADKCIHRFHGWRVYSERTTKPITYKDEYFERVEDAATWGTEAANLVTGSTMFRSTMEQCFPAEESKCRSHTDQPSSGSIPSKPHAHSKNTRSSLKDVCSELTQTFFMRYSIPKFDLKAEKKEVKKGVKKDVKKSEVCVALTWDVVVGRVSDGHSQDVDCSTYDFFTAMTIKKYIENFAFMFSPEMDEFSRNFGSSLDNTPLYIVLEDVLPGFFKRYDQFMIATRPVTPPASDHYTFMADLEKNKNLFAIIAKELSEKPEIYGATGGLLVLTWKEGYRFGNVIAYAEGGGMRLETKAVRAAGYIHENKETPGVWTLRINIHQKVSPTFTGGFVCKADINHSYQHLRNGGSATCYLDQQYNKQLRCTLVPEVFMIRSKTRTSNSEDLLVPTEEQVGHIWDQLVKDIYYDCRDTLSILKEHFFAANKEARKQHFRSSDEL